MSTYKILASQLPVVQKEAARINKKAGTNISVSVVRTYSNKENFAVRVDGEECQHTFNVQYAEIEITGGHLYSGFSRLPVRQ